MIKEGGLLPARERQTILIVDDAPENLELLRGILHGDYRVKAAVNAAQALAIMGGNEPPDLVLTDIQMPGMTGYELCRAIKAKPGCAHTPVIFVTSLDEEIDEAMGFDAGGVDYITKPVSPVIVLARVRNHLALANVNAELEARVLERTAELTKAQDLAIFGLSVLAEYRDNETGAHILRTKEYVRLLVKSLLKRPEFQDQLDPGEATLLYKSSPLHDIGKVAIPDSILLKPGKLTEEEFEVMKQHAAYGHDVIVKAERTLGIDEDHSFFRFARDITISHHEKWDGSGYPGGLEGGDIPLSGRIMAIADVYDALSSNRVYKKAFPQEEVLRIMLEGRGRHFDPLIFDVFLSIVDRFREIADEVNEAVG